ncbi:polysaccharide deacetylase family protein [Bradyrhizobium sp. WSM 1738]|uniref:polysaccharide deacetylase family protein n=1 Tax=Bradyrhizobium hereditatis TaxID=2821405 RepID=UPI001CE273D2|nr:polysaccharide deacetylase family protein [Bradyrhizobium hereditatis]MCA6117266.1 polysaccharide deacetylase family protein [Bradyrhizobium hereditatis]
MITSVFGELRRHPWTALYVGLLTSIAAQTASAADCPGHPDAIGTSRTIVVDPLAYPIIGTMQYGKTLPLQDHEVVLTFDDGPLPKYSDQILEILAAHCAKATFFLVGSQANANPEGVRKVRDAGHTVGTHTQNHPVGMDRLPFERSKQEIEQGIASVTAALGDGTGLAPFLRIPGLRRTDEIEEFAASKGLQLWSADFPADDWRDVSANRVYELAMQRLERKGKGILLLHDIQPRTVAALPRILREMKARGYRIVHVVPATPERPATPTEPQQWQVRPAPEVVATSRWPKVPRFAFAGGPALPAPALSDLDWHTTNLGAPRRGRGVGLPPVAPWPRQAALPAATTLAALPVPAASIFKIPESARLTLLASSARRTAPVAQARSTEVSAKLDGKSRRRDRAAAAEPPATGQAAPAAQGATGGTAPKPAAPGKRVAGLKKR